MNSEQDSDSQPPQTEASAVSARVLVTGATGFVGRAVVRQLVAHGHRPVCLVRDVSKFSQVLPDLKAGCCDLVPGDIHEDAALAEAADDVDSAIHLVGIISEDLLRGQTFERIHMDGTRRVVEACRSCGVRRFIHMSALGTREHAASEYHKTKWIAEECVRNSGLDWTIFRPSIIHGPEGEFMRMMRMMLCTSTVPAFGILPAPMPVVPYFGDGLNKVQPVSVRDVAYCFVAALSRPETVGQFYDLGGPEAMSWKELYRTCRDLMPGAKLWKPMISQPVWAARLMARTVMKLPVLPRMLRFNEGQVMMSQEDSVCDVAPAERAFDLKMRDFREELTVYAPQID